MINKFTCSVYYKRERFSPDGCKSSYEANLNYDPYPVGVILGGNVVLRWPVLKCKDGKWRAQGFEGCGYYLSNKIVTKLLKKDILYVEDNILYDSVSRDYAVLTKEHWKGECNRCGRCCLGRDGINKCKYLVEGIDDDNRTK